MIWWWPSACDGVPGTASGRPIWPRWCPAWSSSPGGNRRARRAPRPARPAAALLETTRVWAEITARERALGLPPTRDPDAGFAAAVAAWCRGNSLADALAVAVAGGTDLSAGDFVRWCRQVIDLLDQVAGVAPRAGRGRGPVRGRVAAPGRGVDGLGLSGGIGIERAIRLEPRSRARPPARVNRRWFRGPNIRCGVSRLPKARGWIIQQDADGDRAHRVGVIKPV